jgi:prepilin-type N-terminal cleavage/methylation domain-containing protein/prepilin-type processing-associated H-X9-DG protein
MKKAVHAFTLIELLAVLAIVGVLTTLAYAGVGAVIGKGHTTRCLANMRQVGTAIQMFGIENGGRLPSVEHGQQVSWTNTLAAYLGTNFISRCPALREYPSQMQVTYGWNDMLVETNTYEGIQLSRVTQPSATMVLAEKQPGGNLWDHFHFGISLHSRGRISMAAFEGGVNTTAHGSKANYLFLDGHVESLAPGDVRNRLTSTQPRFLVP